jgi:phenylpropionate dioxygenase-like ring-hydroxylating dioxygenase large terminal subunit
MLTKEENELLTRVGPGTPCGEYLRRYWQPVALAEELPPGGAPLPVRLMGEDLVLFRDDQDRIGLLGLHCAHRGADLSYGRLEDGGLRCLYHGWLYDVQGRCLEQPGEPAGSTFHQRIRQKAYPCLERARLIFAYLGPGEPPSLPNLGFFNVPDAHVSPTKVFHECSYLQGHEGNIDLVHVSILHYTDRDYQPQTDFGSNGKLSGRGGAPNQEWLEAEPIPTGIRYCKLRPMDAEQNYIRVAEVVMPNACAVPARQEGGMGYITNWHVPIDDTTHWKYIVHFNHEHPLDHEAATRDRARYITPDYRGVRNKGNRYLQDREAMQGVSYTGMGYDFTVHDLFATEGAGPVQDRTQEHLGPSDLALALARQQMLKAIATVQEGGAPPYFEVDPALNRMRKPVSTYGFIPASSDWREHCRQFE